MFAIGNRIPIAATLDDSSDGPEKAPRADLASSSGVDNRLMWSIIARWKVRSVEANCSGNVRRLSAERTSLAGYRKAWRFPLCPVMALTDHPRIHKVTDEVVMESRGQYLRGPKDLWTESRPIEAPKPGEMQIAIRATILCGCDLHYYAGVTTSIQSFGFVGVLCLATLSRLAAGESESPGQMGPQVCGVVRASRPRRLADPRS
jgi:hypothetical protein